MGDAIADIFHDTDGKPRVLRGVCAYAGSARLAEMAAGIGFETVWIEMEHGPAGFELVESMCVSVHAGGGTPTVRVPDLQRHHVLRALESGAGIVVVPMINTAEQAAEIVRHGKFPPLGARGYNTRSRGVGYGLGGTVTELFERANQATHLFAQIETLEAVANIKAICDVPGLSGIFIGPGDLSVAVGCPSELTNEKLIAIVVDCIKLARQRGLHAGILVGPGPMLDASLKAGCDLAFIGGDVTQLAAAWPKLLASVLGKS
jgi:4-hydroxy-2-oxoheptanedioate aldolase